MDLNQWFVFIGFRNLGLQSQWCGSNRIKWFVLLALLACFAPTTVDVKWKSSPTKTNRPEAVKLHFDLKNTLTRTPSGTRRQYLHIILRRASKPDGFSPIPQQQDIDMHCCQRPRDWITLNIGIAHRDSLSLDTSLQMSPYFAPKTSPFINLRDRELNVCLWACVSTSHFSLRWRLHVNNSKQKKWIVFLKRRPHRLNSSLYKHVKRHFLENYKYSNSIILKWVPCCLFQSMPTASFILIDQSAQATVFLKGTEDGPIYRASCRCASVCLHQCSWGLLRLQRFVFVNDSGFPVDGGAILCTAKYAKAVLKVPTW